MEISRVLAKLSPSALRMHYDAIRTAPFVMATIDETSVAKVKARAYDLTDILMDLKYFHMRPWIIENLKRAYRLDLVQPKEQTVLDIGTGFGYFPYVCWYLGQEAYALDLPDQHLYNEITNALRIRKQHHKVMPFENLPSHAVKFDVITAYQIAFNQPCTDAPWSAREWEFFLNDVFENVLKKNGRLYLELNYADAHSGFYSREVESLFKESGAMIKGCGILFDRR